MAASAPAVEMDTEQGVRLATFRFDAQHPKAAAILVHGVGVSCRFEFLRTTCDGGLRDRYEDSALDIMRRAGISILGYDHQSHVFSIFELVELAEKADLDFVTVGINIWAESPQVMDAP